MTKQPTADLADRIAESCVQRIETQRGRLDAHDKAALKANIRLIAPEARRDNKLLRKAGEAFLKAVTGTGIGGAAECGHGWETCLICYGHSDHKDDCPLKVFKEAFGIK